MRRCALLVLTVSHLPSTRYDRYWQGRTAWSDVIRTSRTFTRLVWFHVPLSLSPPVSNDTAKDKENAHGDGDEQHLREEEKAREREVRRVMTEKRMALDLIEG